MIDKNPVEEIINIIKPLLGLKGWDVQLGHGSFITFEFGNRIVEEKWNYVHGEWHLWIFCCEWFLEINNTISLSSEDLREKISEDIKVLEGLKLFSFDISPDLSMSVFTFENSIVLRTKCIHEKDYEQWMLSTPIGYTLVVGPGKEWEYKRSDE